MKRKVFISYARGAEEDKLAAKKIYADLKYYGYEPWCDDENILPGAIWKSASKENIRKSDFFLILISRNLISNKGFAHAEFKKAIEKLEEYPLEENAIFVIPARLEDCEIPSYLNRYQHVDLFPENNYRKGLKKIFKSLEAEIPGTIPPEPTDLSKYEEDYFIYVSYALQDNQKKWVKNFVDDLTSRLNEQNNLFLKNEKKFKVIYDRTADSEEVDIPLIVQRIIENSSIFIAVMSPSYITSSRCTYERKLFLNSHNKTRIIIAERMPEERIHWPEEFRNIRPTTFWSRDSRLKPARILGGPESQSENYPEYIRKICYIGDSVVDLNRESQILSDPLSDSDIPDENVVVIDPAEVTEDFLDERDEIERYLLQFGFRVMPELELIPTDAESYRKKVNESLHHSDVFVQLLSEQCGKTRSLREGICRIQYQCAVEARKEILQWRKRDLDIDDVEDIDQREFLSGQYVQAVSLHEFKSQTIKYSNLIHKPISEKNAHNNISVFLNADKSDRDHAEKITEIMDRHGIGWVLPTWEHPERGHDHPNIMEDIENGILCSDGVIIVYGAADVLWVRKSVFYCRKFKYRKDIYLNLKVIAIYDCPPPPSNKLELNLKFPEIRIIDCRDCFREDAFETFFAALSKEQILYED